MKKSENMLVWLSKNGFGPKFLQSLLALMQGYCVEKHYGV